MQPIGKSAFLAADDLVTETVPLPACYGPDACVLVRTITGEARSAIEKMVMSTDPSTDPGGFRAKIMIAAACNPDGSAMFTDADKPQLMSKNSKTLEAIFEKACALNGIREKDVEALEKN